jgi:hypothetical protein
LTEKCFSLTNFSKSKQTQESLKNNFSKSKFQKTNLTLYLLTLYLLLQCQAGHFLFMEETKMEELCEGSDKKNIYKLYLKILFNNLNYCSTTLWSLWSHESGKNLASISPWVSFLKQWVLQQFKHNQSNSSDSSSKGWLMCVREFTVAMNSNFLHMLWCGTKKTICFCFLINVIFFYLILNLFFIGLFHS